MQETVEDLQTELDEALAKIENIALQVAQKELDAYEGFMQTEEYKDKIVEIGHKLKDHGVDITSLTE
ncbi:MAG: hypothetical protein KAS26_02095 [Sulfurimonas sp.]|nr:hypothetical protein [Sulfurimonas sp.]